MLAKTQRLDAVAILRKLENAFIMIIGQKKKVTTVPHSEQDVVCLSLTQTECDNVFRHLLAS
jgi:hypothetical protein